MGTSLGEMEIEMKSEKQSRVKSRNETHQGTGMSLTIQNRRQGWKKEDRKGQR